MPEIPNAHPGAPLTVWLRQTQLARSWYQSTLDPPEPDAVEYIRKDAADAMLTHAVNEPPRPELRTALATALELLEDDDVRSAKTVLSRCLSRL